MRQVPSGKVTTYQEIAHALGTKAYRAVGQAMRSNPDAPIVPCHRVVQSDGSLGGYAYGVREKQKLLESEGIHIQGTKVIDLPQVIHRFTEENRS